MKQNKRKKVINLTKKLRKSADRKVIDVYFHKEFDMIKVVLDKYDFRTNIKVRYIAMLNGFKSSNVINNERDELKTIYFTRR